MVKVITGHKGAGKTTFLRSYAAQAASEGRSPGGVAAPAVFEAGQRVGYDLIDLRQGSRRLLARVLDSPDQAPTVGQYRFNDITVAEGNRAIIAAIRDRLDIVAIDEVGPLEFRGGGWAPALEVALAEATESQEVILVVRPSLIRNLGELTKQRAELDYVLIESADGRDSAPVAETVTDHLPQEFQLPHPQGLRIRRLGNRPPT